MSSVTLIFLYPTQTHIVLYTKYSSTVDLILLYYRSELWCKPISCSLSDFFAKILDERVSGLSQLEIVLFHIE